MYRSIVMIAALSLSTSAMAQDFDPTRVRLLIHGSLEVKENVELRAHFIPAGNLLGEVAPILYLGVNFKPVEWLGFEPVVGWTFVTDEPIVSLRASPDFGLIYGWADIELNLPGLGGYWFVQADVRLLKWLHMGLEGEGWGSYYTDFFSNGGGPNLLLRYGKVGVDLAIHAREVNDSVGPGFVIRFHTFL
ncbi:MAG: hypothetical protein WC752_00365 [Patescibacteria group bacterium]|jgi:hypothetical protein